MDRSLEYGNSIKVLGYDQEYVKALAVENYQQSLPEDLWGKVTITVTPEEVSWLYKP